MRREGAVLQRYEPFGSLLPGRNYSSASYRFGFQGQVKDDEVYGATGTSYAFKYRMHDARVGRFWSIDPLAAKYAFNSPYAFSENRVVDKREFEGLEMTDLAYGYSPWTAIEDGFSQYFGAIAGHVSASFEAAGEIVSDLFSKSGNTQAAGVTVKIHTPGSQYFQTRGRDGGPVLKVEVYTSSSTDSPKLPIQTKITVKPDEQETEVKGNVGPVDITVSQTDGTNDNNAPETTSAIKLGYGVYLPDGSRAEVYAGAEQKNSQGTSTTAVVAGATATGNVALGSHFSISGSVTIEAKVQ